MTLMNPYTAGMPVHPDRFVGRREEVKHIFARVRHSESVSIVGERSIGKTSLLRYICSEEVRKFLPDPENYLFVYRDLQALAGDLNDRTFYLSLAEGILPEEQVPKTVASFSDLRRLIRKKIEKRKKHIVLVLDEFDILFRSPKISIDLFSALRSLANEFPVAFITSSFQPLVELGRRDLATSPFFNIFVQFYIGPFTRDEAAELICKPSAEQGLPLEPYSNLILDIAGYHPYFLQLACQTVFDRVSESDVLDATDLGTIRTDYGERAEPMFRYILEQKDPSLLDTFVTVAGGQQIKADSRAVMELTRRGYLLEEAGELRIFSSVFRDFINQWTYTNVSSRIETELLKEGKVGPSSLIGLPDGLQVTSLRRFYDEHPELALRFHKDTLTLTQTRYDRFQTVTGILGEVSNLVEGKKYDTISSYVPKIIKTLEEILSIKATSTHVSPAPSGYIHLSTFDTALAFENTLLPSALPLLMPDQKAVEQPDLDAIRHCLLDQLGPSQRLSLLISFGQATDVRRIQQLLDEKLKKVYAYDVVALGPEDLLRFVIAKNPQRELRRLILSKIDLTAVSPFTVTGPTPSNVFVGRESELREISEHASHVSYVVIGGRRIGKSSLLNRLHQVRLPAAGYRTLYHDCSTTLTYESFLAASIREWQPKPPPDAPATFGDLLESLPDDKPLVLLLDEADKLVPIDRANDWRLFNALRAMAFSGSAQIVFSGERTLRGALQDSTSPLFNFGNEVLLGPLDFRAVEELVTRPMKQLEIRLSDEAKIARRIYDFTSGHPNVVQRLCRRLVERLNERGSRHLTLEDVDSVTEDRQFQEIDFLQTYWEAATPLERISTLILSQEIRIWSLKQVRQALSKHAGIQPSATSTKEALDRLVDLRSILKRSKGGYSFAVEAFPRVLANVTTVEDLLEVLVEQYEQTER